MNSLAVVVFCVAISTASCSAIWGGAATLVGPGTLGASLKGPSAQATLVGPDGSLISGGADAGALLAAPKAGGAITAAVAPGWIAAAPAIAAPPVWAPAPILPPVAPVLPAPVKTGTLIDGPSGTIKTSGSANGLIAAPVGPVVGPVGPIIAPAAAAVVGPAPLWGAGLGKIKGW